MVQNLWSAAGDNIFAIPLAAGALASRGILLPPAFDAILMSASTSNRCGERTTSAPESANHSW
jgi:cation transport ATPase